MRKGAAFQGKSGPFQIGTWIVCPALNRVVGPEGEVPVEPRVMRVLERLAEQPGWVVPREELLEAVWADVVVTEDALTRAVSELRKLFGDDPKAPRYVETIRGRGYRLVAPVSAVEQGVPSLAMHAGNGVELAVPGVALAITAPAWKRRRTFFATGLLAGLGLLAVLLWPTPEPALPEAVPFTSFPGRERFPVLSPDGSRVAFTWSKPDGQVDLYVKQTNTAEPFRLTHDEIYETFPVWSPDGSTLAFVREDADGDAIYAVPALGGPARRLLQTSSWIFGWDWAPDRQMLVLSERSEPGGPFQLVLFDLETQERQPLTAPEAAHTSDVTPAFSPNGRTVAFVRKDRLGLQEIHLVATAGGAPRRLTTGALRITGVDWTADGRHLVYASYQNGTFGLWRIAAEGGEPGWIPTRGERLYSPNLAGDHLVFEELWYEKNVWRIRLNAGAEGEPPSEPLIVSTRWDCEAVYSPDGRHLIFTSSRSGHLELWLADADGANPVQLTHFEGPFVGNPRWAPDGRHVAFYATPDGYADLFVLDVEGGPPSRLTEAGHNDWAASFSRDGRWLYFGSDRSGRWELWRMPAAGGTAEQVTTDGGLTGFETADGTDLLYTKPGGGGIWRRSLEGGPEVQVMDGLAADDWGNWWPSENGILFVERGEGGPFVTHYDFATGVRHRLAAIPNIASPSLTLSPDGRSVLYARIERSESDLMLVEDFR